MADGLWNEIEKSEGPPDVTPLEPGLIDERRRRVYQSFEGFLRRRLEDQNAARPRHWKRDYSNLSAYEKSICAMRERLKSMFGFWVDPELRPAPNCSNREVLLEHDDFTAFRYDLEIFPNLITYAVELKPTTIEHCPALLLQHGYGGTPELICGLTRVANRDDYSYRSLGLRAVRRGYRVVAIHHPYGYGSLEDEWFGLPEFAKMPGEYAKNRLHRLALLSGATSFGLDLMASSRGIDLLQTFDDVDASRIGMYGLSQGGQTTLYLAAIDTRLRASVASAYFNRRLDKLVGPCDGLSYLDSNEEDKFFDEVVATFSDADVVSLIIPRAFAVEAGMHDLSVDFQKAKAEFALAKAHYSKLGVGDRAEFIAHRGGHVSATKRAFGFLETWLA